MCKATSELKLCTCSLGENIPDNYWILYVQKITEEGEFLSRTMGELMYLEFDQVKKETFEAFIIASLNNANCFDVHLNIQEDDVLEICMQSGHETYQYYLEFQDGKWVKADDKMDPFVINDLYNKISEGVTKPDIYHYLKAKLS